MLVVYFRFFPFEFDLSFNYNMIQFIYYKFISVFNITLFKIVTLTAAHPLCDGYFTNISVCGV